MPDNDLLILPGPDEARVNVTWRNQNGDLVAPVRFPADKVEVLRWAEEAIRAGHVAGIDPDPNVNLNGFAVDPFPARDGHPNRFTVRPTTAFGG